MLSDTDLQSTGTRPRVGVPVHEAVLVRNVEPRIPSLVPPGYGRSTYVLREPDLGSGRPDLIVLTISAQTLCRFKQRGLRLPSLTAARSLDMELPSSHLGVTDRYAQSLRKSLSSEWREKDAASFGQAVHEAVAIEAKMSDWRRATLQAARFQGMVDRAVILMPEEKARNIPPLTLRRYGLGLLISQGKHVTWNAEGRLTRTSTYNRLWLLELLLRGLENGSAYNASALRNRRTASRNAPTRAE